MNPWWSQQASAILGGVGGGLAGVLCGLYGTAAGLLAPRGRCRRTVLGFHLALLTAGIISGAAAAAAVIQGQPYHVYYPLGLVGLVLTSVMGPLLPVIRMRYRGAEARRMEAESLRRS